MRALRITIAAVLTVTALVACKREVPPSAARAPRPAPVSVGISKNAALDRLRAELEEIPKLGYTARSITESAISPARNAARYGRCCSYVD